MHIEIYKIKGREYRYEVSNYRVGDKIRHKKKYLGPVKPVNKTQRKKSTGRKPSVFVRKLTEEEKQELEKATRSNNAFTKERAGLILYSAQGLKTSEICKRTGREKRSVLQTVKDFNNTGLNSLQRGKTTGRKPKFTEEQKARIVQTVNTDPRTLGKNFTTWSLPKLKQYVIEKRMVEKMAVETLRQILLKGNKKYKKGRKWLFSNDPDFAKKNS